LCLAVLLLWGGGAHAADLAPRAPASRLPELRGLRDPLPAAPEWLSGGRAIFNGKGFCSACHGADGKGFGSDIDVSRLRGALPRDFTDRDWQRARSDGELLWVLRHGVAGTAMGPFVPLVLSETEAWQVIRYLRSLSR
jgi:mono/diheme cytochrome c family protein